MQLCAHVPDCPISLLTKSFLWRSGVDAGASSRDERCSHSRHSTHTGVKRQPAENSFPAQLWKQRICDILRRGRKYMAGEGRPRLPKYLLLHNVPAIPFSRGLEKKVLLAAGSGTWWQGTEEAPEGYHSWKEHVLQQAAAALLEFNTALLEPPAFCYTLQPGLCCWISKSLLEPPVWASLPALWSCSNKAKLVRYPC